MLTSWHWVYLTDFASFKPTYIPEDDISDWSYFFKTSGRTCYLAPERFCSKIPTDKKDLEPAMDVFSLGCVIAELFLEETVFDLSKLIQYKKGKFDPSSVIGTISDEGIRRMITDCIQLEPENRPSIQKLIDNWFSFFSFFYHVNFLFFEKVYCL